MLSSYDIVLIPEVIEHILDLGTFLNNVRKFMREDSLLIIGTPNSMRLHNFFTVLKGYEEVNPDHKYYFSYSTLKRLLEECQFTVEKWWVYTYGNTNRRFFKYGGRGWQAFMKSFLIEVNHWFGDGIILLARLKKSN